MLNLILKNIKETSTLEELDNLISQWLKFRRNNDIENLNQWDYKVILAEKRKQAELKKKITYDEYKKMVEEKYPDKVEKISDHLIMCDSYQRGDELAIILTDIWCFEVAYHTFREWWTSIDGFNSDSWVDVDLEVILEESDVDILPEIEKLDIDEEGYIKVYRGVHEHTKDRWNGWSWTTDKKVAEKFANGCGGRRQTEEPEILEGKVYFNNIYATFYDRGESELVCSGVIQL